MLYYNQKQSNKKHYIRILIILLFMITSMINPKSSGFISKAANIITTPFAEVTSFISYSIEYIVETTIGSKANREMVNKLSIENQDLKSKINDLRHIIDEKEYLKEAYSFLGKTNAKKANVIMYDNDTTFKRFKINKGKRDGIKVGDIVVNPYQNDPKNIKGALIGEVVEVELTNAVVSTILDDTYNISYTHSKSGVNGIIDQRNKGILTGFLLKKTPVNVGDALYTSGTGGRFKKGIYLGDISKSYESVDELKQIIEIKSPVNFSKLYEVFIIEEEKINENY